MKVEQEKIGLLTSSEGESLRTITSRQHVVTHAFHHTLGELKAQIVVFNDQDAHHSMVSTRSQVRVTRSGEVGLLRRNRLIDDVRAGAHDAEVPSGIVH